MKAPVPVVFALSHTVPSRWRDALLQQTNKLVIVFNDRKFPLKGYEQMSAEKTEQRKKLEKDLKNLRRLVLDFFDEAKTEGQKEKIARLTSKAYQDFGPNVKIATGMSCPEKWVQCQNGSCVEKEEDCPPGG
jgi:hypothetical protein